MTPVQRPDAEEAIRLFRRWFLNRTDVVAIRAPWEKPCPVAGGDGLDPLLAAHVVGDEAPAVPVRYENRRGVDYITSGAIGDVTEVHVWTNRPIWPQGVPRPAPLPENARTDRPSQQLLMQAGVNTLAISFWREASALDYAGAAPSAAMMIALALPLTLLLRRQIVEER